MAITDKDIEKLSGHFLTKEDAKQFVTKGDAKQFATKEDLKQFATKEDLKQFATKEDLKQLENKVVTRLDKVMGELEKAREDRVFAKAKDDEQDQRIDNLDKRVQKVEAGIT